MNRYQICAVCVERKRQQAAQPPACDLTNKIKK